jgi:hypothetical protein
MASPKLAVPDRRLDLRFYAALIGAVLDLGLIVWLIATDRWN